MLFRDRSGCSPHRAFADERQHHGAHRDEDEHRDGGHRASGRCERAIRLAALREATEWGTQHDGKMEEGDRSEDSSRDPRRALCAHRRSCLSSASPDPIRVNLLQLWMTRPPRIFLAHKGGGTEAEGAPEEEV